MIASEVERSVARIVEREPWLHAFAWFDADRARGLAREADASPTRGPLHGMPIAVKDIVDTAGIPTENGTALCRGRIPERSASVVERLERAGAIVLGKTVTAELAYFHPGPTVNPYDRSRTPGGSSMGSAAAVAAGEAAAAVGSQTNGSIIRPAAFCGVVGFKPSYGRIPTDGVLEFARSLDTLGAVARDVETAAAVAAVMAGDDPAAWRGAEPARPRLAIARTGDWDRAEPAARERFDADTVALEEAGAWLDASDPLAWIDDAVPLLRTIMAYEGARAIGPIVDRDPARASEQIRGLIAEGRAIPETAYRAALDAKRRMTDRYAVWADGYDAILTPPAVGEAPDTRTTGDPRFCTRWTFLGAPAITLPTGLGPHRLPLGLQLVGVPGRDARLVAVARWAASHVPKIPPPPLS